MPDANEFLPPVPAGTEKPKRKKRIPSPDEDHFGVSAPGEDKFRIRYQRPEVAKHCAKMLIQNNMDYEAAVTKMLQGMASANGLDDPTDAAIIRWAENLRRAPQIQKALQEKLKEIGLDDEADKLWASLLWNAMLDRHNNARWAPAMKMYMEARGITKKPNDSDKPVPLQLQGGDALLQRLGIAGAAGPGVGPDPTPTDATQESGKIDSDDEYLQ